MEKRICGCGCGTRAKSKEEMNAELKNDARRIVRQVDGYSQSDREKRAADLKAAFPPAKTAAVTKMKAKTTVKAAAKPAAKTTARVAAKKTTVKAAAKTTTRKSPMPAGMSVGRHDGDLC